MAKQDKETRKLECKVSKAQVEERKNRLVRVDREISTAIVDKRTEMAEYNGKIRKLREEQENLVSAIEKGIELRDVDCFWRMNDRLHKKELIRADSGTVVDEAAQTLEDKQEDLFDSGPGESDSGIVDDNYASDQKPTKVKGKGKGAKAKAQPRA